LASLDVNRLLDNLRIQLPGAIDDVLRLEIFNALKDFFQDTNIWYEDIDFDVVANEQTYDLIATGSSAIVRLLGVVNDAERSVVAFMDTPGELQLRDNPTTPATYTARVALTINDPLDREGNPVFPMWILNKYQNDIINGVLSRMMAQPAKPYSNAQLAFFYARKFSSAIGFARQEANRRNVYRGQRWQFPQGFNRRKAFG
jgi:hypothetical protein